MRKKLQTVNDENDNLMEQMIQQKSQYSLEINTLRIQLTDVEDKVRESRLKLAHVTMEKDMVSMRVKELLDQIEKLKENIEKSRQSVGVSQKSFVSNQSDESNLTAQFFNSTTSKQPSYVRQNGLYSINLFKRKDSVAASYGSSNSHQSLNSGKSNPLKKKQYDSSYQSQRASNNSSSSGGANIFNYYY